MRELLGWLFRRLLPDELFDGYPVEFFLAGTFVGVLGLTLFLFFLQWRFSPR